MTDILKKKSGPAQNAGPEPEPAQNPGPVRFNNALNNEELKNEKIFSIQKQQNRNNTNPEIKNGINKQPELDSINGEIKPTINSPEQTIDKPINGINESNKKEPGNPEPGAPARSQRGTKNPGPGKSKKEPKKEKPAKKKNK